MGGDLAECKRRRMTMSFVVWLPRRCERRGTWWALVQLMTWHCGIVLEWEWRSRLVLAVLRCAVVIEGDWRRCGVVVGAGDGNKLGGRCR